MAVPIFFLMSGYLFFHNVGFDKKVYLRKLKSRARSLLVPYIIWNALSFLMMLLISKIAPSFVNHPPELNFNYILSSFWALVRDNTIQDGALYPYSVQFWFIRDLMVLVVLTPLIYCLVKKSRGLFVLIVGICFLCGCSIPYLGVRGFSTNAWFFFMLGSYLSINRKNVVELVSKIGNWVYLLYAALVVAVLLIKSAYIINLGIIVGIACWIKFAVYLIDVEGIKQAPILAYSSFFIFATHQPFILPVISKLIMKFIVPSNDIALIVSYFALVALTVLVAIGTYYLLRKFMPRLTAVLTGGRV